MKVIPSPRSFGEWKEIFKALYEKAIEEYAGGKREVASFFNGEEKAQLEKFGYTSQELYDFAEDFIKYGELDFETVWRVAAVRHCYFYEVQKGVPSSHRILMEELPPKTEALHGIEWLPRLIAKAQAKLQGEMPADLMYGCGGDRKFFRDYCIDPADFLEYVWKIEGDPEQMVDYVRKSRGKS